MFFLFHGVVISDFCSAFRLVVKQITSAIFTPWGKIIFIVIDHAEFAMVNHFLITFHLVTVLWHKSSNWLLLPKRKVSTFSFTIKFFIIPHSLFFNSAVSSIFLWPKKQQVFSLSISGIFFHKTPFTHNQHYVCN